MIYVPEDNSFSACYVVQSANSIRAYSQVPTQNSTISYRDYYFNGHYIYQNGVQTFSQYTTNLPTCLQSSEVTHNVFYRNDIGDILIVFFILLIICFYFPYRIISRMFGRWFKL